MKFSVFFISPQNPEFIKKIYRLSLHFPGEIKNLLLKTSHLTYTVVGKLTNTHYIPSLLQCHGM